MRISDWSSDVCSSDLSGMGLLALVYYLQAELFMIDATVMDLAPWLAVAISLAGLALGWVVYDLLCRSPLGRNDAALALVGFVFLVALAYLFTLVFSGRGMMMQLGGLIGTMMVANVFLVIIPNQKKVRSEEHTSELQSLMRNSYAVFCL